MKSFMNLLIMMVLEIPITNYIFIMLEHKAKKCTLVEDLHLLGILNYPINKCYTNVKNLKSLLDNETFSLKINFILILTEIGCQCVHKSTTLIKIY